MSRLSVHPRTARESVFAGGPDQYRGESQALCPPNLRECVLAMEDCCEEAHAAQDLLHNATGDLPRMKRVLESQRVFLLVEEERIRKYKSDLTDEIEPPITELIERAEKGLRALNKKEAVLQTKVEAAQARPTRAATPTVASKVEARRLQLLTRQRERLEEELHTLESEVDALELKRVSS